MIASNVILPSRINEQWAECGMDSLVNCRDRKHFKKYPYSIEYHFNSRGFRDSEWPDSVFELQKSIWCIGDSVTVGLGSPYTHIWPQVLSGLSNNRTINVSLEGSSNNWISRKICEILQDVSPDNIIAQWSFVERREHNFNTVLELQWKKTYNGIKDSTWPDCPTIKDFNKLPIAVREELKSHKLGYIYQINNNLEELTLVSNIDELLITQDEESTVEDNLINFKQCIENIKKHNIKTNIIHVFLEKFSPEGTEDQFLNLIDNKENIIYPIRNLDTARDGWHFDVHTSQWLSKQIVPLLR